MSLLLWEYFWDEASWLPAPEVIPDFIERAGLGGKPDIHVYQPFPEEYWEERAARLAPPATTPNVISERQQRLLEEIRAILLEQQALAMLQTNYAESLQALRVELTPQTLVNCRALKAQIIQRTLELKARITRAKMLREALLH